MTLRRRDCLEPSSAASPSPQLHPPILDRSTHDLFYDTDPSTANQYSAQPQFNPDNSEFAHQPRTHLSPTLSTDPKPKAKTKQKIVTMPPRKKAGGGARKGAGAVGRRAIESAIPAPEGPGCGLTLKLRLSNVGEDVYLGPTDPPAQQPQPPIPQDNGPSEKGDAEKEEEELPVMTRAGRQVRKPHNPDNVYGNDPSYDLELSSQPNKVYEEGDYQPEPRSSPPYQRGVSNHRILSMQRGKPGGPPKNKNKNKNKNTCFKKTPLSKISEEEENVLSSDTIAPASPDSRPDYRVFELGDLDPRVYDILNGLQGSPKTLIDLPRLLDGKNNHREEPWSAKTLVHLYIVCHDSRLWNLCDMIADTWIRAFHDLRAKAERYPEYQIWRPNVALRERKRRAQLAAQKGINGVSEHFDPSPPNYDLDAIDPLLEDDITMKFDSTNLNDLYKCTPKKCGARLLWADALVLGGEKIEGAIEHSTTIGCPLHPDLLYNMLQTSLRLVRRKLTLKIEERSEGAWCKRYHEHWKHGLPCYREVAWRTAGEESSDEDEPGHQHMDDDDMVAQMTSEFELGEKRGYEDLEGGEVRDAKKARFEGGDVDVDAEGEFEDD